MTPKNPFLLKNGLLSLYLRNRASNFDDFLQMLDMIALNDLALVMCTKKSSPPWGHFCPKNVKNPPYDSDFLKVVGFF